MEEIMGDTGKGVEVRFDGTFYMLTGVSGFISFLAYQQQFGWNWGPFVLAALTAGAVFAMLLLCEEAYISKPLLTARGRTAQSLGFRASMGRTLLVAGFTGFVVYGVVWLISLF